MRRLDRRRGCARSSRPSALRYAVVERGSGRSTRELKERLPTLSDRFSGAQAINLRHQPIPWAYRVFYRHIGLDPDQQPTPVEELALERMRQGGFRSRNLLDDALTIAIIESGVALSAFDADRVDGRAGDPAEPRRRGARGPARRAAGRDAGDRRRRAPAGAAVRRARRGPRGAAEDRAHAAGRGPGRRGARDRGRGGALARCRRPRPEGLRLTRSREADGAERSPRADTLQRTRIPDTPNPAPAPRSPVIEARRAARAQRPAPADRPARAPARRAVRLRLPAPRDRVGDRRRRRPAGALHRRARAGSRRARAAPARRARRARRSAPTSRRRTAACSSG